ncbi:Hypothetical predicted protein [Mytilus galloprovincialis]|uniref:Uncharacterized protein n=1 Tax=Mytilus galloprovincialis TaxID=29158 RepID=A0A8B6CW56_MYTGA|nr:Hypothetical predicted protein [Mytilus galloprovincialis]
MITETLNTAVDKILINVFGSDGVTQMFEQQDTPTTEEDQKTVSVLIQLEVPTSWNARKIVKAVEQIRLSGNGDSELKIKAVSNDDLYIFVEIVKKVLRESEKLRIEINQLMTNIFSIAKVKIDERADVNINLNIPQSKAFRAPTRVKIEIKKRIPFQNENFESNCIIAGNHIVFVEIGNRLQIYEINGTFHRNISLEGDPTVQCLTVMDYTAIAILHNFYYVDVLDLCTGTLKNTIKLDTVCIVNEIAYQDGLLYCKGLTLDDEESNVGEESNDKKEIISVVNLYGELIRYFFVTVNVWGNKSIVTNSNRLFSLSNYGKVNCYNLKGALQWKFPSDKQWYIRFMATYEDGQLFVYDDINRKIVLLSADGQSFDEVLTLKNSKQINGMYYDKTLMILMVYDTDDVYLFQVKI